MSGSKRECKSFRKGKGGIKLNLPTSGEQLGSNGSGGHRKEKRGVVFACVIVGEEKQRQKKRTGRRAMARWETKEAKGDKSIKKRGQLIPMNERRMAKPQVRKGGSASKLTRRLKPNDNREGYPKL